MGPMHNLDVAMHSTDKHWHNTVRQTHIQTDKHRQTDRQTTSDRHTHARTHTYTETDDVKTREPAQHTCTAHLADSHDAVGSQYSPLQDVDGWAVHCCPVGELPLQNIPPAWQQFVPHSSTLAMISYLGHSCSGTGKIICLSGPQDVSVSPESWKDPESGKDQPTVKREVIALNRSLHF